MGIKLCYRKTLMYNLIEIFDLLSQLSTKINAADTYSRDPGAAERVARQSTAKSCEVDRFGVQIRDRLLVELATVVGKNAVALTSRCN
jgi:hypothetical protein